MSVSSPDPTLAPPARRRWQTYVGVLLIAGGLGLLGWFAWQYWGTNWVSQRRADALLADVRDHWTDDTVDAGDPLPGGVVAVIRVQRFGSDWEVPVLEGVDDDALASGVGHQPGTALPGETGNVALAGHRVTHGEPFRDFLELRPGDEVELETAGFVYTYELEDAGTDRTVDFSETWVFDPVPGDPGARATEPRLTLLTCSELFHTDDRQVVFGHLVDAEPKT